MQNKISVILKNNKLLLILGALACIFYFVIFQNLDGINFVKNSLYSTGDSLEYKGYADWLAGQDGYCSVYRTFFFPLLIMVSTKLLGFYGIWIVQCLFWLVGCLLTYITAYKLTNKKYIAVIAFTLVASNISLIVYTAHALTEITTFVLLSLLAYLLTFSKEFYKKPILFLSLLFIISAICTTRPVYFSLWYVAVISLIVINYKSIIKKSILFLFILLAISPVIAQKAINKVMYNTYSCTKIADYTTRKYLFRKLKFFEERGWNANFNEAPDSVHKALADLSFLLDKTEIERYILSHPRGTIRVLWKNIYENLGSGNPYINNKTNHRLYKWTENINTNFMFLLHLIFTVLWLIYLIVWLRRNNYQSHYILITGIILFYVLYSSGLSYWAGDRLVVSTVAIWSVLYPFLFSQIKFKRRNKIVL